MTRARDASRGGVLQRHQPIVVVIPQPAEHRGHAAQGGLRAGAAGMTISTNSLLLQAGYFRGHVRSLFTLAMRALLARALQALISMGRIEPPSASSVSSWHSRSRSASQTI